MTLTLKPNSFFVFDLDDTLYPEIEYLESAYKFIANKIEPIAGENMYDEMLRRYYLKENVFEWVVSRCERRSANINISHLLNLYREHEPAIKLNAGTKHLLDVLKEKNIPAGLITDGRSVTQRNKLKSLGLLNYFKEVIISEEFGSEKPDEKNYLFFEDKYSGSDFFFIGDNTSKDFIVPLKLGWVTICIKNKGRNIHHQNLTEGQIPNIILSSFEELILV